MKGTEKILLKSKMSGFEVGRLMIQSYLFELKQLMKGSKEIHDLLSPSEVQHLQAQIADSYDIKIYNSCRRLWEYLVNASSLAEVTKKDIEIMAFKLYFLISNEMKVEDLRRRLSNSAAEGETTILDQKIDSIISLVNVDLGDSKITMVSELYDELIDCLKLWLILQETFRLISERMNLPDLMIMIGAEPANQVNLVNALVKDMQFLHPENKISKALFDKGIGHICRDDEVPLDADVIDIERLKPTNEKISIARKAIKDLTYFSKNWGIHNLLGFEAETEQINF